MKIGIAPPPKAPKSLKTFEDYKKVKKTLDKPTKTVYNIRKDAREVLDLHSKYVDGSRPSKDFENLAYEIRLRCDIVRYVLKDIPKKPVLAGGSLRDLIYGKVPKDYDFFFNCATAEEAYDTIDKLVLAMGSSNFVEGGENENYGDEDNFQGVYSVFDYNNGGIQFIVGVWPDSPNIYERFDLSICQASMPLDTYDIKVSDEFLETLVTKEIKTLKDRPSDYTLSRLDRIKLHVFGMAYWEGRDLLYNAGFERGLNIIGRGY